MAAPGSTVSSKDRWEQKNLHPELASKVATSVTKQSPLSTSTAAKTLFRPWTRQDSGKWTASLLPRQARSVFWAWQSTALRPLPSMTTEDYGSKQPASRSLSCQSLTLVNILLRTLILSDDKQLCRDNSSTRDFRCLLSSLCKIQVTSSTLFRHNSKKEINSLNWFQYNLLPFLCLKELVLQWLLPVVSHLNLLIRQKVL